MTGDRRVRFQQKETWFVSSPYPHAGLQKKKRSSFERDGGDDAGLRFASSSSSEDGGLVVAENDPNVCNGAVGDEVCRCVGLALQLMMMMMMMMMILLLLKLMIALMSGRDRRSIVVVNPTLAR